MSIGGTDAHFVVSEWRDSNSRPPAPKAGTLTGLRYTPNVSDVLFRLDGAKLVRFFGITKCAGVAM